MPAGYIYIMTNPSFPEYVKIGYATDVQQRLDELNRSTAVPFAFRIYATYEVDSSLSDKKLHSILDKLDPELRSTEEVNGRRRVREFYAMSPEDAYDILEAIAEINGFTRRLKRWHVTAQQQADEDLANDIQNERREKAAPFTFTMVEIPVGAEIEFVCRDNVNSGTKCIVADEKKVTFEGEIYSLTALAAKLLGIPHHHIPGPKYFKYEGEWLNDRRSRMNV